MSENQLTLQQEVAKVKIKCPLCGKFLFENLDAKGTIIHFCKQCKQIVEVKL